MRTVVQWFVLALFALGVTVARVARVNDGERVR